MLQITVTQPLLHTKKKYFNLLLPHLLLLLAVKKPNNFCFNNKKNYTFITNLIILPSAQPNFFLNFLLNQQTNRIETTCTATNHNQFHRNNFSIEPINIQTKQTTVCLHRHRSQHSYASATTTHYSTYTTTTLLLSPLQINKKKINHHLQLVCTSACPSSKNKWKAIGNQNHQSTIHKLATTKHNK